MAEVTFDKGLKFNKSPFIDHDQCIDSIFSKFGLSFCKIRNSDNKIASAWTMMISVFIFWKIHYILINWWRCVSRWLTCPCRCRRCGHGNAALCNSRIWININANLIGYSYCTIQYILQICHLMNINSSPKTIAFFKQWMTIQIRIRS